MSSPAPKTLLCFGDSNTRGSLPVTDRRVRPRLGHDERWPGVVRRRLGDAWFVVEEGLGGRTTVHDDPIDGIHKNGLRGLPIALETHGPIDLVVLMLGTNDLKSRFAVTAFDIARSIEVLLDRIAAATLWGRDGKAPDVLLVAPVPIRQVGDIGENFAGGPEKSRQLAGLYQRIAEARGLAFLDAGAVAEVSDDDGIHYFAGEHAKLGNAIADRILAL